ncbi:MAG TPA: carbamoyl-phosphate synthase large subunit [Bdellovibrionales bacterium]|nr:carbamoyl-phosphate synthase large subunit [Bdellovibrionales bacterium]
MGRYEGVKKVLILGSGPIVIGQACEFDYSGTQACKALMKEGLEVILVNSNPATIMTDPEIATRVYVEPLTAAFVEKILEKERPDSIIPTLGGQTALNVALELADKGVLERLNVRMLGATPKVIRAAEDRETFKQILDQVGARAPRSVLVKNFEMGMKLTEELGLPLILRPNYTLGGGGGGIAYSREEFGQMLQKALLESPTSEVLVEESILGWKEFELEVMRDRAGTFVVVCSIENLDPCGVHTGDSITVAPQQTLSDREYQAMRDEARKVVEAVGIETGGANIQFATHPETGERVVIEMNPRVSRSSALASKATGFPIAKIAALLAIGYRLEEITNDITKSTPCCYEPALDYVVTKIPRFTFEKFAGTKDALTTQMKSVGEVMAIGRTFKESLQKALQSLELKLDGLTEVQLDPSKIATANSARILHLAQAMREGYTLEELYRLTQITPWFLEEIHDLIAAEQQIKKQDLTAENLLRWKRLGFADSFIARLRGVNEKDVLSVRRQMGLHPRFEQVDTCAGEFESSTPYFYSSYWGRSEKRSEPAAGQTVAIIGSGPNRIGQGIEFDYSCVRAVKAMQAEGIRVAMINSNPETVSTDYDTANELFFEPLTPEHVREVLHFLQPRGFVAQFGGQTPINLAHALVRDGYKLMGSSLEAIDLAEDRGLFAKLCKELNLIIPKAGMARSKQEAAAIVEDIGFPVMCRPSYVLGGRRMEVVETSEDLEGYFERHGAFINDENPLFIDQFLERALEVDVDVVRGNGWKLVGGIVEHIEAAGVHSGDSMGVLPPQRLKAQTCERIEELSLRLADKLNIIGLLNLQLAVKDDQVYVLEANPRSSRSVPFVVKAAGVPLIDLAVQAILGQTPKQMYDWKRQQKIAVKGVVFPFKKFPEADSVLGPEMKSTGETMGRGSDYSEALLKAFISSHIKLPLKGEIFLSLRDKDKDLLLPLVKDLVNLGYAFSATGGTAAFLKGHGIECLELRKAHQGRPNCVDRIRSGEVSIVFNTTSGRQSLLDSFKIRRSCIDFSVPCITESDAAFAFVLALKKARTGEFTVSPLTRQDH